LVPLRQGPALTELTESLPIVAMSAKGRDIDTAVFPQAFGLLVGMEGPGLPAKWRNTAIRIPTDPAVESLNAATAAALALYQWSQHR
jgi:16S rRNA (guanine527-N7)-methyltransferase